MRKWGMPVKARAAVVFMVASTVVVGSSHPAVASTGEQAILDLTGSTPLETEAGPNQNAFGWQFAPNEDAELSSVTLWQNGSPNTSSVAIHTNINDTIGASLGTFIYEPAASDTTQVATSRSGDPYFAFTYRGAATVSGTDTYWLVVTGGSTATRFIGTTQPNLVYAPGTVGRSVLSGNYLYNENLPAGSRYFGPLVNPPIAFIYVLRKVVASPAAAAGAAGPVSEVRTVAFALPPGMTCSGGRDLERTDGWMTLPSASDCTDTSGRTDGESTTLLGWATTPDFPVSLAQRQVDNGWGAYELFDADGRMTAVFIPAGGATAITADVQLFPVFAE